MKAIMLARHDYRETDQLITFLSAEYGKQTCLAKGVKKITSKNSATLEVGTVAEVEVVPGGEISRLIRALPRESGAAWRSNLQTVLAVRYFLYVVETSILPAQPDQALFILVESWLTALAFPGQPVEPLLAAGVLQITSSLGFTPVTDHCVAGDHSFVPYESSFLFTPRQGGFTCPAHGAGLSGIKMSLDEKKVFEYLLNTSFKVLKCYPLSDVMRQAIYGYISEKRELSLGRWPRILR